MVEENKIEQIGGMKEKQLFNVKLKNFDGKIVADLNFEKPMPFPYLFHQQRLYVSSRDEPGVMLERSYCVLMNKPEESDKH